MNYEMICKYVFANEGVDWLLHDSKKRDRELVFARQLSIYIGNTFFPDETWATLGAIFHRDHATAMHAVKNIKDLMFSDAEIRRKVFTYSEYFKDLKKNKDEAEMKNILAVKDAQTLNAILNVIDKMELVAQIYCQITNNKIIPS
jgi:hypothetical protein